MAVVFFDLTPFMHIEKQANSWPEAGTPRTQSVPDQCNIFALLWIYRHDLTKLLQAGNKYNNDDLYYIFAEWKIELRLAAKNLQGANNVIKRLTEHQAWASIAYVRQLVARASMNLY